MLLFIGILAIVACVAILASVPPVSRDALTHHLAVPDLWLRHGGVFEIPWIPFSYYPMNLDLLYLIPLYFGNDIVPKYIHFSFALLTALLIYSYLRRRLGVSYGLLGSLFFLSTPVVIKLAINVYVDLGLIFFTTAALVFLFRWREENYRITYLIVSGVFCGLALGTKYNALITLFILTCFVPFLLLKGKNQNRGETDRCGVRGGGRQFKALKAAVVFTSVALLVFSPWMIKNSIWTGNPVHPLYSGFFSKFGGGKNSGAATPAKQVQGDNHPEKIGEIPEWAQNHFVVRKHVYHEHWLQTLLIPLRIFFQGEDDSPRYFDGRLNPFLCILPLLAFATRRLHHDDFKREIDVLLLFSILYLLFVFLQRDMRIRWVASIIPPLVMVSMAGLAGLRVLADRYSALGGMRGHLAVLAAILVILAPNARYLVGQFDRVQPFGYLSGKVSRDQYIQKYRPEYHSIQYANRNLADEDTVLAVFLGGRVYYSNVKMAFQEMTFLKAFQRNRSAPAVVRQMKSLGFTHLLLRYDLFNTWAETNYSGDEKLRAQEFFRSETVLLTEKDGYGLFRLKGAPL